MPRPRRYFVMPAIDQPDPEPGFQHSSDEFIVPSTDEEGESVRFQVRVPGQLHGWVGSIVASKKFPFQRDGDLVRYGIYLACCQLARIEKSVPNLEEIIAGVARVVTERENAATVMSHLDHLGQVVSEMQKHKAWGEILFLLAREKRGAEKMSQTEPYWGMRWKTELHQRFADIEALATSRFDEILKESPQPYIDIRPSAAHHEEPEQED